MRCPERIACVQVRLEPEVWQQGGVGPEGAPGRKVKKVFRLEEKSGEEGKKKGGGLFSRKEKKEAVTGRVVLSCCIGEPAALQELEPSSPLSRSIDRDGLGRPARVPVIRDPCCPTHNLAGC